MRDLYIAKIASLKRCLKRVAEEFVPKPAFLDSQSRQDAAILNIQRACEVSIDIANIIIKHNKLGLPSSARDSFDLLERSSIIDTECAERMKRMVGFRNIAIHEYQNLNLDVVVAVIENHLSDFERFAGLTNKVVPR